MTRSYGMEIIKNGRKKLACKIFTATKQCLWTILEWVDGVPHLSMIFFGDYAVLTSKVYQTILSAVFRVGYIHLETLLLSR